MVLKHREKTTFHLPLDREEILRDYRIAFQSRQASVIGRREVLSGKAKFGIFGDGKELAQIAMAKVFRKGDFRSGYYRDQTLMFALGAVSLQEFFAQLYAHADVEADPSTAGRSMNAHFASRSLNPDGSWRNLMELYNSSADMSPTGSQMPRLVGLAYASRLYRHLHELQPLTQFSHHGDEVAFGAIGNASCAEGVFWEAVNAVGVLMAPMVLSIWDDGYGISVTNEHQMVKQNMSELLKGFQRAPGTYDGYDIYSVRGWDYPALVETYVQATETARRDHVPAIIHVVEVTQPQGHSTSGSHERYKSKERLEWEQEFDCVRKFREWIIAQGIAAELDQLEREDKLLVENTRKAAWEAYTQPIREEIQEVADILDEIAPGAAHAAALAQIKDRLLSAQTPLRRDIAVGLREALLLLKDERIPAQQVLIDWKKRQDPIQEERYSSHLYSRSAESALNVPEIKPVYSERSPVVHGFELLNACFDAMLARDPRVIAFGEDVGRLGDVNQGFAGLQAKYGELRVSDTGIRETTIIGQAIGLALRGLRPIAEIQYLDYVLYALQIMSDDLVTLHWRTKGGQKAPVIVRTRGHRLEGIWHSGSPMAGLIHLLRGMHVLVPRNMTQAAGFYNTLLRSDDPGLVVEVLNGYRLKETLPDNIEEFTVPVGVSEVLREGNDITLVTYGACCRIVMEAAELLRRVSIDAEVVDVQSLLPFDVRGDILESLKKTSRIVFIDEDVPGGATAYMLQEVIEKQGGYAWLDSPPRTLSAKPHRPAYGSDGDYWSKPNVEQVFETAYEIMHEVDPAHYPLFYR
ncbi:MAG: Pyruvate/2-oxoglutarate dehydrogenase complex, dehydrogenase component beta subunit [Anaerolineales bacterium]|nr:Pyruvate/2-oxoglutarate dehydrogenase complex, dehydrogenase component beta subunit [Anaerolineales bacterium]